VVLNDEGSARSWLAKFELLSAAAGDSTFHGFEDAFRGILERSLEKVKHGISAIVGQHSPLCRAGSLFHQTEDELLSVWGIGMANLALSYGFRVESNGPLIPANLLIEAGRMRV
jgi:hypothetical protein